MKNKTKSHDKKTARTDRKLMKRQKELAKMRRERPREEIDDVELAGPDGPLKLSQLFGSKRDLIVIHNMGRRCPYCTLWADGLNGIYPHLADRAAVYLLSHDAPSVQKRFAASRGWKFPMVSGRGSDFIQRLGFGTSRNRMPGVSTFVKGAGNRIQRVAHAKFGPFDPFCAIWHLFALLDNGVGSWAPQSVYGEGIVAPGKAVRKRKKVTRRRSSTGKKRASKKGADRPGGSPARGGNDDSTPKILPAPLPLAQEEKPGLGSASPPNEPLA